MLPADFIEERRWKNFCRQIRPVITLFPNRDNTRGFTITECWIWIGAKNFSGYGKFTFGSYGQSVNRSNGRLGDLAHRYMYYKRCGELKKGFVIDHVCGNRSCVNPAHLRQVQPKENRQNLVRRGYKKAIVYLTKYIKGKGWKLTKHGSQFLKQHKEKYEIETSALSCVEILSKAHR